MSKRSNQMAKENSTSEVKLARNTDNQFLNFLTSTPFCRRLSLLIWCLGLVTLSIPALGQACATGRYSTDLFSTVNKSTGILYGINYVRDYAQGTDTPTQLFLDFYEPTGDTQAQRPLIIFAFGGSFINGQRSNMDELCQAFAKKGYVTAAIDYRLVPPGPNGLNYALVYGSRARFADQLVRAGSDLRAAIRFFRRDAAVSNTYRIDPTKIFVAGYSSGAFMALQAAYVNTAAEDTNLAAAYAANGGLEGNTDLPAPNNHLPNYNSANLAGVLSMAGGLLDLDVMKATDPPLYAAHGDNDMTVPYNSGPAFGSSPYTVYGGGAIYDKAIAIGLNARLYRITGGDHNSTTIEPHKTTINNAAAAFFQQIICPATLPVTFASFKASLNKAGKLTATWTTSAEKNNSHFILQLSRDGKSWTDLVRKEAAKKAAAGADYQVEATVSSIGLAGFGILGILLLPLSKRRYRFVALLAVLALVIGSCAKGNQVDDIKLPTTATGNNNTFYVRLAQFDLNGTISYSDVVSVKPL